MADTFDLIPAKGEVWTHTKSGKHYVILGASLNAITDKVEVSYAPLYDCEFTKFTRQTMGHPKAWIQPNEDGSPRYTKRCGEGLISVTSSLQGDELAWYRMRTGGM